MSGTSQEASDPVFAFSAPQIASTVKTPSGLTQTTASSRSVTLANPNDPLNISVSTDRTTINGVTYTRTYDKIARTVTLKTPENRVTTLRLDATGRVISVEAPGVAAVSVVYDAKGRPSTVTQGDRTSTFAYDPNGYLSSVKDPLLRETVLTNDALGRPLSATLPDLSSLSMSYDAASNVTSISPPGRTAHAFSYESRDLESNYLRTSA